MRRPKYEHNFASGGQIWTNKDIFESSYNILFNSIHVMYGDAFKDSSSRHIARYMATEIGMKFDPTLSV